MNVRQLTCFVAVVEDGSFTRAARRIGIAQPSLSQHIRALEEELGGAVLERHPRGISLTPAGRSLLPEARAAVRAVERGRRAARAALALESGDLEIATVLSMAVGLLPRYIRRWHERHPNIGVRLQEFRHRTLLEQAVEQGIADFAIGPLPLRTWDGLLEPVSWEEFVIVAPPDDPLARRGAVSLEQLADREWVLYHPDHGLAGILEEVCRRAGFSPRGTVRTSQAEGAARLASAGIGPALVPDNIVLPGIEGRVLHLDPPLIRDVAVYARTTLSPSGAAFVEVLRSEGRPRPRGAETIHL
ncbi:MAG TPA: LysR family transcriptional regulator [Gaiellaceae bacterium]|nr:LysR family transcriptional regulator [Gaiellaceae bacterium]